MNTLVQRILELAHTRPDTVAVAFKKETLTYARLAERIQTIGTTLRTMGIKPGDRVLFTALSKPEMPAVYLGIQYAGAIAVFIDKNTTAENAAAVYEDARAALFLTDKPMKERNGKDWGEHCNVSSLKQLYAAPALDGVG